MYYFIVNPSGGSGSSARVWRRLEKQLNRRNIAYQVLMTRRPGDAADFAARLTTGDEKKAEKTIIVVGGDGTLNDVLQGIHVQANVTLGVICAGSGNDFARGMRLIRSPGKQLKHLLDSAHVRMLDYGVMVVDREDSTPVTRRFLISSGIGYDAAVCRRLDRSPVKKLFNFLRLGRAAYVVIGLEQILLHRRSAGEMILDGETRIPFKKLNFISAHILPFEGGGFRFAPRASEEDGMLSLCAAYGGSRLRFFGVLANALVHGKMEGHCVKQLTCREVTINLRNPLPLHADGEVYGSVTAVRLRCEERKLRFLV